MPDSSEVFRGLSGGFSATFHDISTFRDNIDGQTQEAERLEKCFTSYLNLSLTSAERSSGLLDPTN